MRRIAVLSACVLVGGVVAPTAALATDGGGGHDHGDDSWIAVEDGFAVVLPDGTTFTGDDEPGGGGGDEAATPVGTQLFISELLYASERGGTRGDVIGRTQIECTAQVTPDRYRCDATWVFDDDGSQLDGTVVIGFATEDPAEPQAFDVAVTGGTGEYAGATGVVSYLDTTDMTDPTAETTALYEPDLGGR